MVELEDDRIALAAVDAGMLPQKRDQVLSSFFDQRFLALSRGGDVALFIGQVVLSVVFDSAWPAVVVSLPPCLPPPREFLQGFLRSATPTPPHKRNI
jgi:hypothetical protein